MEVVEVLRYMNSADGPNIPLRTLAAYCGCSHNVLSEYLNGKYNPSAKMQEQLAKGMSEMVEEMQGEIRRLYNRNI